MEGWLGSMRVLVVDDDRAFLNVLRWALDEAGHEVVIAPDGAAGLALVSERRPDVILLDVRMPGMDGATFARRYGELPGPQAPIVVLSGLQDARDRIKNAAAYMVKPFELDALIALLARVGGSTEDAGRPNA